MLTNWDDRLDYDENSDSPMIRDRAKVYRLFVAALTDLLSQAQRYHTLLNRQVSRTKIYDALRGWYIRETSQDGESSLRLNELFQEIWPSYMGASEGVKNPFAYMQSCIWSAIRAGRQPQNLWRSN